MQSREQFKGPYASPVHPQPATGYYPHAGGLSTAETLVSKQHHPRGSSRVGGVVIELRCQSGISKPMSWA